MHQITPINDRLLRHIDGSHSQPFYVTDGEYIKINGSYINLYHALIRAEIPHRRLVGKHNLCLQISFADAQIIALYIKNEGYAGLSLVEFISKFRV